MNDKENYLGNPLVKRDGVVQEFAKEELEEYIKCMRDPVYFARNYIKVINLDEGLVNFDLYPYQEKMFRNFTKNRFNIVLSARQSGKSISSCAWLLHYAIFNPEKTIVILANKGSTAREMLGRITLALENLPFFLQPGCKTLNKGSIHFSNNSKIFAASTSSSSIRGQSCVTGDTRKIFAASTSSSSIRGQSCVTGDTRVCVEDGDDYYFVEIDKIINKAKSSK